MHVTTMQLIILRHMPIIQQIILNARGHNSTDCSNGLDQNLNGHNKLKEYYARVLFKGQIQRS